MGKQGLTAVKKPGRQNPDNRQGLTVRQGWRGFATRYNQFFRHDLHYEYDILYFPLHRHNVNNRIIHKAVSCRCRRFPCYIHDKVSQPGKQSPMMA